MSDFNLRLGDYAALEMSVYREGELYDPKDFLILFTIKKPFTGYTSLNPKADTEAIITKNSESSGGTGGIDNLGGGKIRVNFFTSDFNNVLEGVYDYDLQISQSANPQDTVITILSGQVTIQKEITTRIQSL